MSSSEEYMDNVKSNCKKILQNLESEHIKKFLELHKEENEKLSNNIFSDTIDDLIKSNNFDGMINYTLYRSRIIENNKTQIFYFPSSYHYFFNKIIEFKQIPKNILSRYLREIKYNYTNIKHNDSLLWIDVMKNKYNYKFDDINLAKIGYVVKDIKTICDLITIFVNNDIYKIYENDFDKLKEMMINFRTNEFFKYILTKLRLCNIDSLYNFLMTFNKVYDLSKYVDSIVEDLFVRTDTDVGNNIMWHYDKIIDIILKYKLSENIYCDVITKLNNYFDNYNEFAFWTLSRIIFEQQYENTIKKIDILNVLDDFINKWNTKSRYDNCSLHLNHKKKCAISKKNFLLNYTYEYIKRTENLTHEKFIKNIKKCSHACTEKICEYIFCYKLHLKYKDNIELKKNTLLEKIKIHPENNKDILEVIMRNYIQTISIENINKVDSESVMKYACIHNDIKTIKYLLSQKKVIPNLNHVIYASIIYPLSKEILELFVDHLLVINKDLIDILYNCHYEINENSVFDNDISIKAKEYDYTLPNKNNFIEKYKITANGSSFRPFMKPFKDFSKIITKLDPNTKQGKKNIEKSRPSFCASLYNPDILVFEYLVDNYNYIPAFIDIIKIHDNKRKYLLLKRFGYLKN